MFVCGRGSLKVPDRSAQASSVQPAAFRRAKGAEPGLNSFSFFSFLSIYCSQGCTQLLVRPVRKKKALLTAGKQGQFSAKARKKKMQNDCQRRLTSVFCQSGMVQTARVDNAEWVLREEEAWLAC